MVAEGLKKYEFRSWNFKYRGKILIHAGAGVDKEAMNKYGNFNLKFPKKKIVAKVTIEDCIKLNDEINKKICLENPMIYGNKNRTGYAWKLTNTEKIFTSNSISGKQGIWYISDEELSTILNK